MTFKFIRPIAIVDAKLTSSSVPETDYAAWNAATNYTIGDRVIRTTTHKIYENTLGGVNATIPESLPARWVEVGATNRWAMFDQRVGSATTASDSITVVLAPGRFNSLALLQIDAATVTVDLTVSSVSVYSASMDLTAGNLVGDWYQYFYEPVYQQESLVITDLVDAALLDLPAYSEGVLTITIARTGGTVSCGVLVVGLYAEIGTTEYQPTIGLIDYSRKETDVYGNTSVTVRGYSKRMNTPIVVPKEQVDYVARLLAQYRSTALVWVGAGNLYTSMIIYGFYKDWEISIDNYSFSKLNLQVEGLA